MSNILTLPDSDTGNLLGRVAEEFRQGFEELAGSAERELSGRHFAFSRYGKELYPCFEEPGATVAPGCIIPVREGWPVASVDSTCVLVGETSKGALYASRAAVCVSQDGGLKNFFRLGPMFVYVSERGFSGIRVELTPLELGVILSDHSFAERVIRNAVERKIIESLLQSERGIIVMADGSLRHPFGQFSGDIPVSRSSNCLVGLSKSSNLIFSEGEVAAIARAEGAAFFTLEDGAVKTVLAKFARDGLVFRLDLSTPEPVARVLGRIMWNDSFSAGYPESLKIAHHLSVFTRADDNALKAFVTKRFGVKKLQTFAVRRIALGGFKGSG